MTMTSEDFLQVSVALAERGRGEDEETGDERRQRVHGLGNVGPNSGISAASCTAAGQCVPHPSTSPTLLIDKGGKATEEIFGRASPIPPFLGRFDRPGISRLHQSLSPSFTLNFYHVDATTQSSS